MCCNHESNERKCLLSHQSHAKKNCRPGDTARMACVGKAPKRGELSWHWPLTRRGEATEFMITGSMAAGRNPLPLRGGLAPRSTLRTGLDPRVTVVLVTVLPTGLAPRATVVVIPNGVFALVTSVTRAGLMLRVRGR